MGGGSSSYEASASDINYTVGMITSEAIFGITRKHDLDDDVKKLLKQAALTIHNFDSYRDNMQVRAYGEGKTGGTVIITAGKGENVLEVQTDGRNQIQCTWTKHSTGATCRIFFEVVAPKLVEFILRVVIGGVLGISVGDILKSITQ